MDEKTIAPLLDFLNNSPTCYHAAANAAAALEAAGHTPLREDEAWQLSPGMRYYVAREGSLLAFRIPWGKGVLRPRGDFRGFLVAAAHSDSPSFLLREEPEVPSAGNCVRLEAEPYGGGIWRSWLDRPLTVAGRAVVRDGKGRLAARLVYVDRDLLVIPSLAIHMDREVNKGTALKPQTDLLPLFALNGPSGGDGTTGAEGQSAFRGLIAEALAVRAEDIVSTELYLVPRDRAALTGARGEFLSGPRLDDLLCVYALLQGYLTSQDGDHLPVLAILNHEEVGSGTWQGADSDFLSDTLRRVCDAMGQEYPQALSQSFLVSADNAHAVHPAHPEMADAVDAPVLGGGVVLKYNANRRYITDAVSAAVFREICRRAEVPVQRYSNRPDLPGGSTLGHIATAHLSVRGVDVGLPQLAMHSAYEVAAASDAEGLIRAMAAYFACNLRVGPEGITV